MKISQTKEKKECPALLSNHPRNLSIKLSFTRSRKLEQVLPNLQKTLSSLFLCEENWTTNHLPKANLSFREWNSSKELYLGFYNFLKGKETISLEGKKEVWLCLHLLNQAGKSPSIFINEGSIKMKTSNVLSLPLIIRKYLLKYMSNHSILFSRIFENDFCSLKRKVIQKMINLIRKIWKAPYSRK